jgi:hypothetical protein
MHETDQLFRNNILKYFNHTSASIEDRELAAHMGVC